MTQWAVFYRPPEHRRFDTTSTSSYLDDPAFSPDPRSHPHYPLADARSYKALPSKSPSPSLSSESESLTSLSPFTSPALSSATSPSQSHGSPSPLSLLSLTHSNAVSPLSTHPKHIPKPPPVSLPMPEILPKPDSTNTLARVNLKLVASQNTNIPRKAKMKALVRRLTSRHNLDRIDELDETDPFGGSYHHDGPYEATGGNLTQPDTSPRGGNPHSKRREIYPRALRPGPHQVSSVFYHPGRHILTPLQFQVSLAISQTQSSPDLTTPEAHHYHTSRRVSLMNPRLWIFSTAPRTTHHPHPCMLLRNAILETTRLTYPVASHSTTIVMLRLTSPKLTVFPPPRYESIFHSSGPPRLSQRTTQSSLIATPRKTQTTESTVPALPPHSSRHQSVRSLDSSYKPNSTITRSSSCVQNKPLEPPRIRHLPKRLVMPAPLQPQLPSPQHNIPPAKVAVWQDGYPDNCALEGAHFEGQPAMYSRELRLLRKRSSAFPAKAPIPDHAPIFQNDAVPVMGISPTKTGNEAEGTKEGTRRRRLSKRKNDI
ncbi:hypothetical protein J3R82DRAFT_609 [Butyriboletus roseoflavus]|nr:hypothetical protein J3R82DRAFT_609 [Butyriboletus roseoflavus]